MDTFDTQVHPEENQEAIEEQECLEHLRKKEAIAWIIFEPECIHEDYNQPSEEDCHKVAEEILEFLS